MSKKYIFKMEPGQPITFEGRENNHKYYEVQFRNKEDPDQVIKFTKAYAGENYLRTGKNIKDAKFHYSVHKKDQEKNTILRKEDIPFDKIGLKVVIDENCEYQLAVCELNDNKSSCKSGDDILPKILAYTSEVDWKNYYDQGFLSVQHPTHTARLEPLSIQDKSKNTIITLAEQSIIYRDHELVQPFYEDIIKANYIVITKDENGNLFAYLSDEDGNPCDWKVFNVNNKRYLEDFFNPFLKSALKNCSNISEVLPEFAVDVCQFPEGCKSLENFSEEEKKDITHHLTEKKIQDFTKNLCKGQLQNLTDNLEDSKLKVILQEIHDNNKLLNLLEEMDITVDANVWQ
ncbi:MAG: hypothetical protein QWI36_00945 [Wolbachia endosymbiont of Tyrophagus putrescentiae]|nr:hypothetical protein [Wolbachia endosymbiont of Tyrophagus putrescentiae]